MIKLLTCPVGTLTCRKASLHFKLYTLLLTPYSLHFTLYTFKSSTAAPYTLNLTHYTLNQLLPFPINHLRTILLLQLVKSHIS